MSPDLPSPGGLAIALALPWLLGVCWLPLLTRQWPHRHWLFTLGSGYLLGIFATTLGIRLWDALGLALSFEGLSLCFLVAAMLGLYAQRRWPASPSTGRLVCSEGAAATVLSITLGLLILWRYTTLGQELLLRPLFAWDAWMNWAPKAIIWFHEAQLVDFVSWEQWLAQGPTGEGHTLGNRKAWGDPPGVPLIQLWSMLGAGTWDHPALFLPWLILPLCLAAILYGYLRCEGITRCGSLVAAYCLLSMPYLNTHTVLAGYADIWLASAFALGVIAFHHWQRYQKPGSLWLCIIMALMCSQLKTPGLVLAAILVLALLRDRMQWPLRAELTFYAGGLLCAISVLFIGFEISLPGLGPIALNRHAISLPRLGEIELGVHNVAPEFIWSLVISPNWNLLALSALCCAIASLISTKRKDNTYSGLLFIVTVSWLFLLAVFFFTKYYLAAKNFITLNRALLYVIPVSLFYLALWLHSRLFASKTATQPATSRPAENGCRAHNSRKEKV